MIRQALFAGSFYPRFAKVLSKDMDDWISSINVTYKTAQVLGVIVPHAGYMYSGRCAAYGFHRMLSQKFDSIIVLHPSHRGAHFDFSVSPYSEYDTPFGSVERDQEIYEMLLMRENSKIEMWYHENEHSLEIQLPFVKRFFDGIPINGIMFGNQCPEVAKRLALQLADVLAKTNKRIAIVVSTDLSHYRPAEKAELLDAKLIKFVRDLDPDGLWQALEKGQAEACGIGGLLCLLYLAQIHRNSQVQILSYTHSGIVSGANDQVVGYLSAAVTH